MSKEFIRKTKESKPVVAICYDFDKTLSPDDMQAQGYIQSVGDEVESFWKESNGLAEENDMDQNLAYMFTMIQKAHGKVIFNRQTSCVNPVQNQSPYLFGKGILIACIDSGVDYTHPDFRNVDGSTRILRLWDQSIPGNPPKGYRIGSEYTQEQINRALEANTMAEREALVPSIDTSGHGTAVLGIAAGNGRESQGTEQSVGGEAGDPGTEWISQNHRADAGGGLCDPHRTGASDAGGDQSKLRKQLWST